MVPIDGSHIPIKAPKHGQLAYRNRKGFLSVVLQGCIDFNGAFININVGYPGRAHNARVYRNSSFGEDIATGKSFPRAIKMQVEGRDVYPYILGEQPMLYMIT